MLETVATRPLAKTDAASEERPERLILTDRVERRGAYWESLDRTTESDNWNELADENEIHAAISTFDEAKEAKKSRENVEFVLSRLEAATRVLDLGCGYGRMAKYLLPSVKLEAYVGVDCSPVMLKKFHERYAASEAERATPLVLVRGDIDRIPLQDAVIDTCIVSAVYLHNHKDVTRKSIAEIRRVLKPGGRVVVISSFPNAKGLTGLQGWAYLFYLKLLGQERKNGPVRYFTCREVARMFAGFRSVTIRPSGFSLFPKTILGMSPAVVRVYHRHYARIHGYLARVLPKSVVEWFCVHHDVVAEV